MPNNTVNFNEVPNNVDFLQAFQYANTGKVTGTTQINGGTGYINPSVAFSAPSSGIGRAASGVPEVATGVVTSVLIVDPGEGYVPNEVVTALFTDTAGVGADFSVATDAAPVDLTGSTLSMMVRVIAADPTVLLFIDNAGRGGITITDAANGKFSLKFAQSDIVNCPLGTFVQDLIRLRPDGVKERIWSGAFTITQGVTRE